MVLELLTFAKDRLTRLKNEYATAIASGEPPFQFDGHDLFVDFATYLIKDLENYFKKSKKAKPVYRFSSN